MTTTVRGSGRAKYEAFSGKHGQRDQVAPRTRLDDLPAAPMTPPNTPWGRVAEVAQESGWTGNQIRAKDGRRIVSVQRGRATVLVVWDSAQNVLSQSWNACPPEYDRKAIRSEKEALEALQRR